MITLISPHYHDFFQEDVAAFDKRRDTVFNEKLGCKTQHNKDSDHDDGKKAWYLIYKDAADGVCGGMRLLPTTSFDRLKNTFLLDPSFPFPCHPLIWELSCFFFDKPFNQHEMSGFSRRGTLELMVALTEFMVSFSPHGLLTVTDTRMEALYRRLGFTCRRLSPPYKIDQMTVICLFIEANMTTLKTMRETYYIKQPLVWVPLPLRLALKDQGKK